MSSSIDIDDIWDEPTTCREYGSHMSWHTRNIKKVTQLHQFLEKTFDRAMNEDLNVNLQKAEGEVAVLHEWDVSTHSIVRSKSNKEQVDPLDYFICCRQTFRFFLPGLGWAETD